MIPAEIIFIVAGISLAGLIFLVSKEKFLVKKYPAVEFLLKKKSKAKKKKNKITGRGSILNNYIQEAYDAGWNVQPYEVIGIAIFGMIVGAGFGLFIGNEILAVAGLSLGYLLPRYILSVMVERRRNAISMQLESAMNTIASSFDVHGNVLEAFRASIPVMESPIKDEFQRVVQEVESGVPLEKALLDMEKRVGRKELVMFNRVAVVAENAGGRAGDILQKCARVVAENRLLKSDLETEVTQVKQDTRIMFSLTLVSLIFFRITNSELFDFYQKIEGKIVMLILLGLAVVVTIIANKTANPKEIE